MKSRRILYLVTLMTLSLITIQLILYKLRDPEPKSPIVTCENTEVNPNQLNIALFDNSEAHDEVVLAFAYVFASIENSKLFLFKDKYNYQMEDILFSFDTHHHQSLKKPDNLTCFNNWIKNETGSKAAPDIVLAGTCEHNFWLNKDDFRFLLNNSSAYLFCVVHQAMSFLHIGKEEKELFIDWNKSGRIMFLTLSPHVTKFFKTYIQWLKHPTVNTIIPVFPVKTLVKATDDDYYSTRQKGDTPLDVHLAIQGYYQSDRRGYSEMMDQFREITISETLSKKYHFTLHLLGNGVHPEIPAELKDKVLFHDNLTYEQYYELLSTMFTVLPTLSLPDYTWNKISSTIPASLIAQIPLLASPQILEAYTFLNTTLVWTQGDKTEFEAVLDILEHHSESIHEKREAVRQLSQLILDDNKNLFHEWFEIHVPKYKKSVVFSK